LPYVAPSDSHKVSFSDEIIAFLQETLSLWYRPERGGDFLRACGRKDPFNDSCSLNPKRLIANQSIVQGIKHSILIIQQEEVKPGHALMRASHASNVIR